MGGCGEGGRERGEGRGRVRSNCSRFDHSCLGWGIYPRWSVGQTSMPFMRATAGRVTVGIRMLGRAAVEHVARLDLCLVGTGVRTQFEYTGWVTPYLVCCLV